MKWFKKKIKEVNPLLKKMKEIDENPNFTSQEKFCFLVDLCNLEKD